MSFIPYSCQNISDEDVRAVTAALRSDFLTQGPSVPAFENAFAEAHGVKHAIAVSNATAALHIGCIALGIGPGKRVWTSPNSFVASANCALYVGATVDFVDIDPETRNMSVAALEAKLVAAEHAGVLPDLVIPVDFAGLSCDLVQMRALADRYGFRIMEDASHATGGLYQGRPVGGSGLADLTVFSFHAVKIVTSAEGGMLTTDDDALAYQLRLLRSHGISRDPTDLECRDEGGWYYEQVLLGYNYRLTEIQAALGLSQLARMEEWRAVRDARATRYDALLADIPLRLPARMTNGASSWHLYAIELGDAVTASRAEVFAGMRAAEIGVNVHYIPIHLQPYYRRLGFKRGDFPAAEAYYDRAISIPLFPAMTDEQQDRVVSTLRSLIGARA